MAMTEQQANVKEKKTFKEYLTMKIPPLYAWLTVGGLSAAVLVTQIVLLLQA